MTDSPTPTALETTISVINTLVPIAASVVAMIGGVPVPVLAGIKAVQALLPTAEALIMNIGNKTVTLDTGQMNDPTAIIKVLQEDVAAGWPVLSFTLAPTPA